MGFSEPLVNIKRADLLWVGCALSVLKWESLELNAHEQYQEGRSIIHQDFRGEVFGRRSEFESSGWSLHD